MANEKRLIDAVALADEVFTIIVYATGRRNGKTLLKEILEKYRNEVLRTICKAPTVDAVEVVHGRWKKTYTCHGEQLWGYECDQCKADNPRASYFCPNCGSDMRGDEK